MIGSRDRVGLIPAAGRAARISPLPCSKEIFPVGFSPGTDGPRPRPVCADLLNAMARAGADRVCMVIRPEKWDIPAYLGNGGRFGLRLAYLAAGPNGGAPETLDQAAPFLRDAEVLFGFPDIRFHPPDVFLRLGAFRMKTGAEAALGLFRATRPEKMDMVALDDRGGIRDIVVKPRRTDLVWTWILAVWSPAFTEFLHESVRAKPERGEGEWYVGDVFRSAIADGMPVTGAVFEDGRYVDIGTPEDLVRAVRDGAEEEMQP
jgi:glucose-1-phosphate thymidylyltransferase